MTDEFISPPVSEEQKVIFDYLTRGGADYKGLAAFSGRFQGQDVCYIVQVTRDGDGMMRDSFTLIPMAIIVDLAFLERYRNEMFDSTGTPAKPEDEK